MNQNDNSYKSLNTKTLNSSQETIKINEDNPFAQTDYAIIIKAFEMETSNWEREDYAKVHLYRDVYSTRHFSERVQTQLNYYPGMHQSEPVPSENPFKTTAEQQGAAKLNYWKNTMENPESFEAGLRNNQKDFDYTKIFGTDISAKDRAKEIGKMISECVPCFGRLLDGMELLPDGNLLEIHAMNIKIRTDLLDKIKELFKSFGMHVDICELLKLLTHICPKDLLAMLALLTQYLAKLNLDFRFNLNFIIQLVGPILSPFLDGLSAWLDKWIQLILNPMICVTDHINQTIYLANSLKIPFSEVGGNIEMDLGIAAPFHKNASSEDKIGGQSNWKNNKGWMKTDLEAFNTPNSEKYNPIRPEYPSEEATMARKEIDEAWNQNYTPVERAEADARWKELKANEQGKRSFVPPPERPEKSDGTRWSKDSIPPSEKYKTGQSWETGYYPPEKQSKPYEGIKYVDTSPIVNSVIQLRNILQGAIQYVKDWFTYITQMIYDLLGTDIGWMEKKTDNTIIKSNVIQMIAVIKAIIDATRNNGLKCGLENNYDQAQMQYILQEGINKVSTTQFDFLPDGSIQIKNPNTNNTNTTSNTTNNNTDSVVTTTTTTTTVNTVVNINNTTTNINNTIQGITPSEEIILPISIENKQKTEESSIIIKDCFRSITKENLAKAQRWIQDFETNGII